MCSDQLELPLISLNNTIADDEHSFTTPPAQIRVMVKCPRAPSTNKRRRKAVVEQLFSENKDVNNTNKELIFIPVYDPLTKRFKLQLGLNLNDTKFVFKTVYDPIRKRFYNPAYQFRLPLQGRKCLKILFFFTVRRSEHEAKFNNKGVAVESGGANKNKIMYCTSLCLSSDGSTLFSGYIDGVVRDWGIGRY